jgi:hypothetical protein
VAQEQVDRDTPVSRTPTVFMYLGEPNYAIMVHYTYRLIIVLCAGEILVMLYGTSVTVCNCYFWLNTLYGTGVIVKKFNLKIDVATMEAKNEHNFSFFFGLDCILVTCLHKITLLVCPVTSGLAYAY